MIFFGKADVVPVVCRNLFAESIGFATSFGQRHDYGNDARSSRQWPCFSLSVNFIFFVDAKLKSNELRSEPFRVVLKVRGVFIVQL